MIKNTCLVAVILLTITGCQTTSTLPQSSKFIMSPDPPGANCHYKGEVRGTLNVSLDLDSISRAEAQMKVQTVILGANYLQLIHNQDPVFSGHAYFCSNLDL